MKKLILLIFLLFPLYANSSEIVIKSATSVAGNASTTFTVPNHKRWKVLYAQMVLTTDATVANRQVRMRLLDSSSTLVFDAHAGTVQTASATSQHYEFMQGVYRETSFIDSALQVPIPIDSYLQQKQKVQFTVSAGVAGDSYSIYLVVMELP